MAFSIGTVRGRQYSSISTGTFRAFRLTGANHSRTPIHYFGEEIGSWRDTFVIDSIAFKTQNMGDENADPHKRRITHVERWTRPDAGHLHLNLTIEDRNSIQAADSLPRTWVAAPGQHTRNKPARKTISTSPRASRYGWTDSGRRNAGYDNPATLPRLRRRQIRQKRFCRRFPLDPDTDERTTNRY